MPEPCRIYSSNGEIYALVDEVDFQFLSQWKWSPKWSRGGKKVYLRRVLHEGSRECRVQRTRFLHHEVADRMGLIRPSDKHILDHCNGDGLDCRRENLEWETHKENRRNINGLKRRQGSI